MENRTALMLRRATGALRGMPWTLWLTIACALWIFRTWYFSFGDLTFGDLKTFTPESLAQDFPFARLWLGNERLGFPTTTFVPFYVAFAWFFKAGLSWAVAERILFFWFFPVLMVGGVYGLAQRITRDPLAAGAAALVAVLNTQTLTLALGGHTNDTNATALVAWVLWGTLAYMQSGRRPWLLMALLALALQSAYDLRWNPPTFALAILLAFAWTARTRTPADMRRAALVFGAYVFAIVCSNLYWLLPKLIGSSVMPSPPNGNLDVGWVLRGSVITWTQAFAGWNPYFMNGFERPPLLQVPAPPYALLIPITAVAAALLVRRRIAAFFLGMLAAFTFLGKGANEPFGAPYVWAFEHLPIFGAYRDPSKLAIYVGIASALLIALGIAALHRDRRAWAAHAASACVASVAIWVAFHAFDPSIGGVVRTRTMPAHYVELNRFLAADAAFGRVLWMPTVPRWVSHTLIHPAADGVDLGRSEFLNYTLGPLEGPDPTSFVAVPVFKDLLRWGGFRYVAVAQDVDDDATVSGGATSVVRLVDQLRANPNLRELRTFGPVTLFVTAEQTAHAWTAENATIARGAFAGLEGAALVPGALGWSPLIFDGDAQAGVRFERLFDLNRAGPPPLSGDGLPHGDARFAPAVEPGTVKSYARIASADSVVRGAQFADSLIDTDGPPAGMWLLGSIAGRATTTVWPPVVDAVPPAPLAAGLPSIAGSTVLQHRGSGAVDIVDARGAPWFDRTSLDRTHSLNTAQQLVVRNALAGPARVSIALTVAAGALELRRGEDLIAQAAKGGVLRASWIAPAGWSGFTLRAKGSAGYHDVRLWAQAVAGPGSPAIVATRVAVSPARLYDRPMVRVVGGNVDPQRGRLLPLYELRDRYDGHRFILAGPTLIDEHDPNAPVDVRSWLQECVLSEPGALADIGINDRYDRLDLSAVDVLVVPRTDGAPLLAGVDRITVLTGEKPPGEPIRTLRTIAASSFTGERIVARHEEPGASVMSIDFSQRAGDRTSWSGAVATLSGSFGTEHAAIAEDDGRFLRGFNSYGQPFVHPWGGIGAIADGPEMALVRIPFGRALERGMFALDVDSDDPTMHIKLALGVRSGGHHRWLVHEATKAAAENTSRFARIRIDLASALAREALVHASVDGALVFFERVGDTHVPSATVRMSDARVSGVGTPVAAHIVLGTNVVAPGNLQAADARLRTTAGSGKVPLVLTFSRGAPPQDVIAKLDLAAVNHRAAVNIPKRSHWFIFSERFDPGWELRAPGGAVVQHHMIGFGFANAWYDARGMQGAYTLEYTPDRLSPLGFVIGYGLLLLALVWAVREARAARA